MAKWFLRFSNRLISVAVGLCLAAAALYAGYALWDNRQIARSADGGVSGVASGEDLLNAGAEALGASDEIGAETDDAKAAEGASVSQASSASEGAHGDADGAQGRLADDANDPDRAGDPETEPGSTAAAQASAADGAPEAGEATQADQTKPDMNAAAAAEEMPDTELGRLFARLKAINPDIGGWITMPGTAIDYAVVRGQNNIEYVSTDIYGNFAIVGSIFLDSRNETDYSDTYNLLYGHNMSEHRMFSDVNLYKEKAFFNANQKGYIYFPTGAHWLQTVSVIVTPASNSWMLNPDSWDEITPEQMLELVQTDALFVSDEGMTVLNEKIQAQQLPRLVALSTCSNEYTDARTILLTVIDP